MASRVAPGVPINQGFSTGAAVATTTTGVKRTYTCPNGFHAKITHASFFNKAGAATVQLRSTIGGIGGLILAQSTVGAVHSGCLLAAGDTFDIRVDVLDAAGSADMCICAEEYPVS